MTNAITRAIAIVTALWLGATSIAAQGPQTSEPAKDQLDKIRLARTVRVVVKVSPPGLAPRLPLKSVTQKLLTYAGLAAVEGDADLTFNIEGRVESTYQFTYRQPEQGKPTASATPTGTTLAGVFRFDGAHGVNLYSSQFKALGDDESDAGLRQVMQSFSINMLEAIGKIFGTKALLAALKDVDIRLQATAALRKLGDVEALVVALKDEDARTRIEAARILGDIGGPQTVEPLIAALKDMNADVRQAAVESLMYIIDSRVVEPLIAALKDESKQVRLSAAAAFRRINDPRAVAPLVEALNDQFFEVRGRAASALANLKDIRTLGAMLQSFRELKDRESSSPSEKQEAQAARHEVKSAILQLLEGTKDPSVSEELAKSLKDPDVWVRWLVVEALAKIRAVDQLVAALKDESKAIREYVVQFLVQTNDPRGVEPLIAALQDPDARTRAKAALGLWKIGDTRAVEPLIAALQDPDAETRRYAVIGLGEIKDPRAVEPLINLLKDEAPNISWSAAQALGEIRDPRAIEALISALTNPDADVRSAAARALGKFKDPRAIEPLIAMLKNKVNTWQASEALKMITGQDFGTDHDKWKEWWQKSKSK